MSGLERVGSTLGAFPMILKVLEAYRGQARSQEQINQNQQILDLVISEQRRLRSTLEVILYTTLPPDEVQQLLQDLQSPRWGSPEVDTAFRNTLGDSGYDEFAQRLRDTIGTLSALQVSISRLTPPTTDMTPVSRRSQDLRSQSHWPPRGSKLTKEMEEMLQRKQLLDMYVSITASKRSVQARQNLDDALRAISGIETISRKAVEAMSSSRNVDATLGGDDDAMSDVSDDDVPVPYETERSNEGAKLRYLDVTIQSDTGESASQSPAAQLSEQALLDSGATHCMISVALAHKLGLKMPVDDDLGEVRTLVPSDNPSKCWEAKVNLRWTDRQGELHRTKTNVYVVFETNLGKDLVLSQAFMENHEAVWYNAVQIPERDLQVNMGFLGWLRPDDKKKQAELLAEIEKKNQARYEAESSKRQETGSKLEASDASEAGPSAKSDPGPSSASSGSSQCKQ